MRDTRQAFRRRMVFLGLNISNISLEQDTEPPTTWGRTGGVEFRELGPTSEEVCEEALDETSETGAGCN